MATCTDRTNDTITHGDAGCKGTRVPGVRKRDEAMLAGSTPSRSRLRMRLDHMAVWTRDLERLREFYSCTSTYAPARCTRARNHPGSARTSSRCRMVAPASKTMTFPELADAAVHPAIVTHRDRAGITRGGGPPRHANGGRRGPGRGARRTRRAMGTTRRSFAIRTAISSRSLSRACKESNRRRVMPDGAECRTARNARRRGMPDGAKRRYGPAPFGIWRCSACGAIALRVNGLRDPAPGR